MDVFQRRIRPLFASAGISVQELATEIGIPARTIYNWRQGLAKSYDKYFHEIAEYFAVPVEWLKGEADPYGLTPDDWIMMGAAYKQARETSSADISFVADGESLTAARLKAFEDEGVPLPELQLVAACGRIKKSPSTVFEPWKDKIWGSKKAPINDDEREIQEYLQVIHDRPQLKTMFKRGRNATPEKLDAIIALLGGEGDSD